MTTCVRCQTLNYSNMRPLAVQSDVVQSGADRCGTAQCTRAQPPYDWQLEDRHATHKDAVTVIAAASQQFSPQTKHPLRQQPKQSISMPANQPTNHPAEQPTSQPTTELLLLHQTTSHPHSPTTPPPTPPTLTPSTHTAPTLLCLPGSGGRGRHP